MCSVFNVIYNYFVVKKKMVRFYKGIKQNKISPHVMTIN